jgi:hypothetical protein
MAGASSVSSDTHRRRCGFGYTRVRFTGVLRALGGYCVYALWDYGSIFLSCTTVSFDLFPALAGNVL